MTAGTRGYRQRHAGLQSQGIHRTTFKSSNQFGVTGSFKALFELVRFWVSLDLRCRAAACPVSARCQTGVCAPCQTGSAGTRRASDAKGLFQQCFNPVSSSCCQQWHCQCRQVCSECVSDCVQLARWSSRACHSARCAMLRKGHAKCARVWSVVRAHLYLPLAPT